MSCSPVPPGTAAAARAAQTQEAEGECDGLATTNPGLGGMDIGDGDGGPMGYVVPAHSEEHGYAPALASGDMTYSGDGGYVSGGGTSGPASIGGGGNSGPNSGAPSSGGLGSGGLGSGGAVVGTASGALFDSNRLDSGGNRPGGGFEFGGAANVPAVAAASGARAADASPSLGGGGDPFSGPDGSGRGFSGGVDARGAAKSHFSNGGAASDGFVYRDTTAGGGNQTLQGQHRAVSGSLGHVSMHKNAGDAVADIDAEEPQATFVETSGSNAPLVQCTASLATGESISCLAIASSPAAPRVALGLHDGHVVILDLALFERLRKFPAHVH